MRTHHGYKSRPSAEIAGKTIHLPVFLWESYLPTLKAAAWGSGLSFGTHLGADADLPQEPGKPADTISDLSLKPTAKPVSPWKDYNPKFILDFNKE